MDGTILATLRMAIKRKSPGSRPAARSASGGQVRLSGGDWRGRQVHFPALPDLRPTGDRIRETLFNWLAPQIAEARVLDLFAGSGALGLEALSRGAAQVDFVERQPAAATAIRRNLARLTGQAPPHKNPHAAVHRVDALDYVRSRPAASVDILFSDPPFAQQMQEAVLQAVATQRLLRPGGRVYAETQRDCPLALPPGWRTVKEKRAGDVCYRLLDFEPPPLLV